MKDRILRINQLLKKEIGGILLREISFQGVLITITRVDTAVNLDNAKVHVSVIPEAKIDNVFNILKRQVYHIQKMINKKLKMRPIPKIVFVKEKMTKEAGDIERILESFKKE